MKKKFVSSGDSSLDVLIKSKDDPSYSYSIAMQQLGLGAGESFPVCMELTRAIGCDASILIGYLIGQFRRRSKSKSSRFPATVEMIQEALRYNKSKQYRVLKKLKQLKLLKVSLRGMPPRRYIRLDFPKIWRMIDDES